MDSGTSSIVELGRFLTGFLVVMGVGVYMHSTGDEVEMVGESVCC